MPAMWCWPQPFGQPLILMRQVAGRLDQVRPRAQVIVEQPAEAARLRDREPAGLGARAAGDVGDRAGAAAAEPGRGELAVERGHVGRVRTQRKTQVLIGGRAHGAVAVGARQLGEHAHLLAREVAERHGHRDDRDSRPASAGARSSRAQRTTRVVGHGQHGPHRRANAGPAQHRGRTRAAAVSPGAAARAAVPVRRRFHRRVDRDRRATARRLRRGTPASSRSNSARHASQPSSRIRNFIRLRCLCL